MSTVADRGDAKKTVLRHDEVGFLRNGVVKVFRGVGEEEGRGS